MPQCTIDLFYFSICYISLSYSRRDPVYTSKLLFQHSVALLLINIPLFFMNFLSFLSFLSSFSFSFPFLTYLFLCNKYLHKNILRATSYCSITFGEPVHAHLLNLKNDRHKEIYARLYQIVDSNNAYRYIDRAQCRTLAHSFLNLS